MRIDSASVFNRIEPGDCVHWIVPSSPRVHQAGLSLHALVIGQLVMVL